MLINKFFEITASQFVNELVFSGDSQWAFVKFISLKSLKGTILDKNGFWLKCLKKLFAETDRLLLRMLAAIEYYGLRCAFVLENDYSILVVKVNAVFFFGQLHFD